MEERERGKNLPQEGPTGWERTGGTGKEGMESAGEGLTDEPTPLYEAADSPDRREMAGAALAKDVGQQRERAETTGRAEEKVQTADAGQTAEDSVFRAGEVPAGTKEGLITRADKDGRNAAEAVRQREDQRAFERQLEGIGLNAAGLFELMLQSPLLRQTTALAEEALAARAAKKRAETLREITALIPEFRSVRELENAPEYPAMQRMLRQNHGMSELDAFKLAFFDRLTRQRTEAGRQEAINAARERRHIAGVGGQPAGADDLTDEEIREYRKYNPGWTVAEIRRFHREYLETAGG